MNKTFFKKLLLAIPLQPNIAAVFAVILGALGLFLPSVYIFIHVQNSFGSATSLVISRLELFEVIDLVDTWSCSSYLKSVELPPYWLTDSVWNTLFRGLPIVAGMQYFQTFGTKKSRNTVFALVMLYIVSFLGFSILVSPEPIKCASGWEVNIYDYSVSWFSFFVPIFSLLLGIFAYQKQKALASLENPA